MDAAVIPFPAQAAAPVPRPAKIRCEGVGLFDLKNDHCRFVVAGEGLSARFCAKPKVFRSWCAAHRDVVFDQNQRRRG
ncbi:MAG TPA: hypothetical protein VM434_04540 [Beijerinckiaceae bacterium]|nr:hypothetical protein [Beijerinckiaceae bacterium]